MDKASWHGAAPTKRQGWTTPSLHAGPNLSMEQPAWAWGRTSTAMTPNVFLPPLSHSRYLHPSVHPIAHVLAYGERTADSATPKSTFPMSV